MNAQRSPSSIGLAQAMYYVVSGLWPVVSMRSFEAITGRKVDGWLVRMVGLLAAVIGLALASEETDPVRGGGGATPTAAVLGMGSALAFAAVDVVYVARHRIRPVYLLDAAMELAFVRGWLRAGGR